MKSGLYAWAGASATASAAAWAKRFDDPITNESKVYFGLMLAVSPRPRRDRRGEADRARRGRRRRRGGVGGRPRAGPAARVRRRPSPPRGSDSRKCPSIHSRVKSFGTASTNASSSTDDRRPTSLNQFRKVVSFSAPRRRAETSLPEAVRRQLDRVLHAVRSAPRRRVAKAPTIAASSRRLNGVQSGHARPKKSLICRENHVLHTSLHRCGKQVSGPSFRPHFPRLFALGQPVDKRSPGPGGYTPARPSELRGLCTLSRR